MNKNQHTRETVKGVYVILLLAGFLFAMPAWAQAPGTESSSEADLNATQGVSEADVNAAEEAQDPSGTESQSKSWWKKKQVRRKARLEARREQMAARMPQATRQQAAPAGPLHDLGIAFKLDPRLTRGLYMGDRWVSNSSGIQEGKYTVEVRVQGVDANGRKVAISPAWKPSDPEMVAVARGQGSAYEITVTRPGQSSLKVNADGVTRTLTVKAEEYRGNALKVDITQ